MKKYFILIVSIILTLGMGSCKKELKNDDAINLTGAQSDADRQVIKKILAFKDKIETIRTLPNLKTGNEPMPVDSAIWYIEATSNYTYGDATSTLESFVVDSSFIQVPVTNGQILWSDVQLAYDQVIDSLSVHNDNITANDKQLIVADISLKESDETTATFGITSGFGTDEQNCGLGLTNTYPWYWGWEQGRCDGSGLGVGCDAADKIPQLANYEIAVPIGSGGFYTDVYTVPDIDPFMVPTTQNPYGEYLLFLGYESVNYHPCLSTDEIAYYKNALIQIGQMYQPTNPVRSVVNYKLDDTVLGGGPSSTVAHLATIRYGVWVINNNPPSEF